MGRQSEIYGFILELMLPCGVVLSVVIIRGVDVNFVSRHLVVASYEAGFEKTHSRRDQ